MTKAEAREQLDRFLGGKVLTFSFEHYPSGEWVATCNEIPSIVTGGMGDDITSIDQMLREAIVCAAGVPAEHTDALRFVSYAQERGSFFDRAMRRTRENVRSEEAQYVLA